MSSARRGRLEDLLSRGESEMGEGDTSLSEEKSRGGEDV